MPIVQMPPTEVTQLMNDRAQDFVRHQHLSQKDDIKSAGSCCLLPQAKAEEVVFIEMKTKDLGTSLLGGAGRAVGTDGAEGSRCWSESPGALGPRPPTRRT